MGNLLLLPTKLNLISGADICPYALFILHKKSDLKILVNKKPYFSVIMICGTSLDSDKNTWDNMDNVTERACHLSLCYPVYVCFAKKKVLV